MVNREMVQLWVDALRSGVYKQCFYSLKEGPSWNPSYCAIGVLGALTQQLDIDFAGNSRLKHTSSAVWSGALSDMTGVDEPRLWYGGTQFHVAALNDSIGLTFNEIATLIEEQYLDSSSYRQAPPQASSDGVHAPSPSATPALQEVGFSDSTTPTGSDSSEGEREAYAAEEEEVTA